MGAPYVSSSLFAQRKTQPFLLILLMTLQRSAYTTRGPELPSIDSACHLFTTKCQKAVFKTKTRVNSWPLKTVKRACFYSCNSSFTVNQAARDSHVGPARQTCHLPSTLQLFVSALKKVKDYFHLTGKKRRKLHPYLWKLKPFQCQHPPKMFKTQTKDKWIICEHCQELLSAINNSLNEGWSLDKNFHILTVKSAVMSFILKVNDTAFGVFVCQLGQ